MNTLAICVLTALTVLVIAVIVIGKVRKNAMQVTLGVIAVVMVLIAFLLAPIAWMKHTTALTEQYPLMQTGGTCK